jgi:hypothetical protein
MSEAQQRAEEMSNQIVDRASNLQEEGEQALIQGRRRAEEIASDVRDTAADVRI